MIRRLSALALVVGALGCESPRTQIMIGLATDMQAPDAFDRVELVAVRAKDGFEEVRIDWTITGDRDEPFNLPGSFGLYSSGDESKVKLELTGYRGANAVVSRRAVLNFVDEKTLFIRMGLTASCVQRTDCTPSQSCVEGVCRDTTINEEQLPDFEEELIETVTCTGAVQYIHTATGAPLAASPDAENCPVDQCFEGVCYKPPPAPEAGTRTVTGEEFTTFVRTSGTTNVPADLSQFAPEILVQEGSAFRTLTGSGTAAGTFQISDVPNGPYYLKVGTAQSPTYYVTSSSTIDLTSARTGKPATTAPALPSSISLDVTNLASWADGDVLEAYSSDADTWWFDLSETMDTGGTPLHPITDGTTSLSNYTITTQEALTSSSDPARLIQNDDFAVVQLTQKTNGDGVPYRAATRFFQATPFTQTDGGTAVVNGTFIDVGQTTMADIDMRTSAWAAAAGFDGTHAMALHPQSTEFSDPSFPGLQGTDFTIHAVVGGPNYGHVGATADFLFAKNPSSTEDVMLRGLQFGTPHTGGMWATIFTAGQSWRVSYQLPGTTVATSLFVRMTREGLISQLTGPIGPLVGPVRAPKIGGADLFQSQTGVGLTPTLAWTTPAIGKPSEYIVGVYRLAVSGTATTSTRVATIRTTATSVTIPPGVLAPTTSYAFSINAATTPNPAAPLRQTFPYGSANIASGIIVP